MAYIVTKRSTTVVARNEANWLNGFTVIADGRSILLRGTGQCDIWMATLP